MASNLYAFWLKQPPIIWYAITIHLAYGIGYLVWGEVPLIAVLGGFSHFIEILGVRITSIVMLIVGSLALIGLVVDHRIPTPYRLQWQIATLLPQYGLLLFALLSSVLAMVNGLTINKTEIGPFDPRVILGLMPISAASFWHTLAILARLSEVKQPSQLEYLRKRVLELELEIDAYRNH